MLNSSCARSSLRSSPSERGALSACRSVTSANAITIGHRPVTVAVNDWTSICLLKTLEARTRGATGPIQTFVAHGLSSLRSAGVGW